MKNQTQKGFAVFILAIALIAIITGGWYYFFSKGTFCWPYCKSMTAQDRMEIIRGARQAEGWHTYTNTQLGFSLMYPADLVQSSEGDLVHFSTPGQQGYSTVTLSTYAGTTVDDSTGKWGTYKLRYDAPTHTWIATNANERDGSPYDTEAKPIMQTASGLQVFSGGIRTHGFGLYDYIVALSPNKFILISGREPEDYSITGTSQDPVIQMIQTIEPIAPKPMTNWDGSWKTYTNNDYGFSIQYPSNWKVISGDSDIVSMGVVKFVPS